MDERLEKALEHLENARSLLDDAGAPGDVMDSVGDAIAYVEEFLS